MTDQQQIGWDGDGVAQGGGALDQVQGYVGTYVREHRAQLAAIGPSYVGTIIKEDQITQQIVAQLDPAEDAIDYFISLVAEAVGVPGFQLKGVDAGQQGTEESNVSSANFTGGGKH